ncbi:SCAN box domain-containing protein [Trichonephila clavipes]|uniref:SCAN box domain-containing protein n=1 Tax=Trichonephila clavipes TaxID=2585209 RepID=A0A8X6VBL1_TRICX|nr:SCAN box domain-containing protein [Trichonephila clavipes]
MAYLAKEEVKIILDRVISDTKERERSNQEEKEREERSKQEEKEREERSKQEEKEREEREREIEERMAREARQHELELRKLEISQQNQPLNDESRRREWIAELQVKTLEQLKDLFITEQLKYRVPAEVREHFLFDWIKLKTPYELAEKLDEYESIKQSFRREIPKKNSYKFRGGVNYSGARPKETP